MIEVTDGVCPKELLCDKCINRRRFMISENGQIYGVFCLSHNDVVSPVPDVCLSFSKNFHEVAKGQHTLKLEF